MRTEIERRRSNTRKTREFFAARPGEWINAREFEAIGGRQGWRTRISELRQLLEMDGEGTIENRLSRPRDSVVVSEYRYLPHVPLGPDASTPRAEKPKIQRLPL